MSDLFKKNYKRDKPTFANINLLGTCNIVFWRTVKTKANSFNYYTDGIFTDEYFIINGYLKAIGEVYHK